MSYFTRLMGTRKKSTRKPGDVFGVVSILRHRGDNANNPLYFDCKCLVCGRELPVASSSLTNFRGRKHCSFECKREHPAAKAVA